MIFIENEREKLVISEARARAAPPTRARAQVPFTRVPVCPGTDVRVTFVRVRTDVQVAICQVDICPGTELIGVIHILG